MKKPFNKNPTIIPDTCGSFPLLYMYGKASGRTPLPSLLQTLLLRLHPKMAHGAKIPMPSLSSLSAFTRTGKLPMGRGSHSTIGHSSGSQFEREQRRK